VQFAYGDGVVSSFFLWKDRSEQPGFFWNELDFEKLGADCELETNAFYGDPEAVHAQGHGAPADYCGTFHTYAYEWTPDYIAWYVDGVEIRRETGETATAYAANTPDGMQIRFNVWPGDATFGGNFDPAILPVHQYINWVQYSAYVDGAFQLEWREDFSAGTAPSGWRTASWGSPKNLSTHTAANVSFVDGYAVLSLTADDATGPAGAAPLDSEDPGPPPVVSAPADPAALPTATGTTEMPASSEMGAAEGCSMHMPDTGRRADWGWLALGLLLRRMRRA
jgi:beta-glucanase (GH16 family)